MAGCLMLFGGDRREYRDGIQLLRIATGQLVLLASRANGPWGTSSRAHDRLQTKRLPSAARGEAESGRPVKLSASAGNPVFYGSWLPPPSVSPPPRPNQPPRGSLEPAASATDRRSDSVSAAVNIKSEPPRAVEREPQQGHIPGGRREAVVRSDAVHTNIASLSPAPAQGRRRRPAAPAVRLPRSAPPSRFYSLTVLPDALDSESFIHYCHLDEVRMVN